MNKLWTRIFVFGAALLLLLFFSNDFGMVDIQKTSIVTAIGIDAAEEEGKIDVTAQIAVPSQAGQKASNVEVTGSATVGEAIAEFNQKTGWYPTLVHCRLVLLGEEVAREDVFGVLDFFLRSQYVEDSCLVAVCEGKAAEALQAKSPVGDLTFSAIEKVLSSEAQQTGLVSVTSLREFAMGYFSESGSGFLPYLSVKREAMSDSGASDPGGESADGSGGGSSGGGSAPQGSGGNDADVFDASRTMLFDGGRGVGTLGAEETLAFNLAASKTGLASGEVTVLEEGREVTYTLKMKIGRRGASLRLEGEVPVLTFRIRAQAQVTDANAAGSREEIAQTAFVPAHVLRAAEEKFRVQLSAAFEKSRESGCDLFRLRQKLWRHFPARFDGLKDTLLQDVRTIYDISFDTLR